MFWVGLIGFLAAGVGYLKIRRQRKSAHGTAQ
jgi:hypothetical protein